MDRGVPTKEVLAEMRRSEPPVQSLCGTPKGRLNRLEQSRAEFAGSLVSTSALPGVLHGWVRKTEPAVIAAANEQVRVKQLEREVAELRRANEILRKASAYFAQAELDRRGK